MEIVVDLLKISIPAALVLYAMYLTIKSFTTREIQKIQAEKDLKEMEQELAQKELALKSHDKILPIRLQAYERLCLFLERISPVQLIPRLNNNEFSVGLFQQILLQEIRNEYAHNLSQQMYVSEEVWLLIKKAMEEMILLVNNSTMALNEDAEGIELAKTILQNVKEHEFNPSSDALLYLKNEMKQFF